MKRWIALTALATLLGGAHAADPFPGSKPITIVVPFAAGGPTDRVARDLAEALRKPLGGATVIVDNAAGAGGSIGANKVAKAPADGHTLLLHHISMATMPTLVRNIPFKVDSDFEYLGMINDVPMTVVARPSLEANNFKDLVTWINQNKGKINIGNAGPGSLYHLIGEKFSQLTKLQMLHVPYKGIAPLMTDLMGGQIDMAFLPMGGSIPQTIADGKVQGLAVTSKTPHPLFKQFPPMATIKGLEAMEFDIWSGIQVHKNTPDHVVSALNKAFYASVEVPETRKAFEANGNVILPSRTPAELARVYQGEIERYRAIAKSINLQPQ